MLINLSEIMSVKGKIKHVEASFERESVELNGEQYKVVGESPISLMITHIEERKVIIEGNATVSLLIPCSRCLEDVKTVFNIQIDKGLDFNETDEDRIREMDETNFVVGYQLNVDILVLNEILINFPMKVLCNSSCKGICNVCGANQNKTNCDCDRTVGDPRMSAIQDIFKNSLK